MQSWGKYLIIAGAVLIVAGLVFLYLPKKFWPGNLPGDITWRKGNTTVYFPIVTSIILSILLSLIFFLVRYLRK